MITSIAASLLIHTGHAITALVSLGETEEILGVKLFDTHWQRDGVSVPSNAAVLLLVSHHPEGCDAPYAQDLDNLVHFRRLSGLPVRLWIASEYFSDRVIAFGESP